MLLLIGLPFCAAAQNNIISVPATGSSTQTINLGELFYVVDPSGNNYYPNNCDGQLRIVGPENSNLRITGHHRIYDTGDTVFLLDGHVPSYTNTYTFTNFSSRSIVIYTESNILTIRFKSDSANNAGGFTFAVACLACDGTTLCQDFTDLTNCNVSCFYGTYDIPEQTFGQIYDRHTVITQNGYDEQTNNQLSMIPPGATASIRLGNSSVLAKAESIVYKYTVDTSVHDLLLMQYAAVLQNPNHMPQQQPRFKFDVLDADMNPVNSNCYSADFVAGPALGWNNGRYGVLWKDWTPVAVDLAPMHGQTIYIKLTTYDCREGGHFGYAYFTLGCTNKVITATNCGNTVGNTFTAPPGFTYRWYRESAPGFTLSNSQSLTVTDSGTYCCAMSMVGASGSNCGLLMKVFSGSRYPYARFTSQPVDTTDCLHSFQFRNNSVITTDSAHTQLTPQPCEGSEWDFGDGSGSTERNPIHYYYPGTYQVRLIATLANGGCQDTTYQTITITSPCEVYDTIYDTICPDGSITFFDTVIYDPGCYTHDSLFFHHTLHLTQEPYFDTTVYDTIVENQLPWSYAGETFTDSVSHYSIALEETHKCNGTLWYNLHVYRNIRQLFDTAICDNLLPYCWGGHIFTTAGSDTTVYAGPGNIDTLVVHTLTVHPTYAQDWQAAICDDSSYTFFGQHLTAAGHYSDTLATMHQCDSVINLQLTVHPTYHDMLTEHICQGESYLLAGQPFTQPGHHHIMLTSAAGCDSLIDLDLIVHPTYEDTLELISCDEPWVIYNGRLYYESSNNLDTLQSVDGCDSVIGFSVYITTRASAELVMEPGIATHDERLIRLSDQSRHSYTRDWIIDGMLYSHDAVLHYDYPLDRDSVPVTLYAIHSLGCNDTASKTLYLQRHEIWCPNAFTPDEASNNRFCTEAYNLLTEEVDLYTRSGLHVAHFDGLTQCWDGTHRGEPVPQGVYVYIIHYTTTYEPENILTEKGTVLLMR